MSDFIERHQSMIRGVLGCYDRVVVQGTLPGICYADGMTTYLYAKKIRIYVAILQSIVPLRNYN